MFKKFSLNPCKFHLAHVTIVYSARDMIGARQRNGHMTFVWSVTVHYTIDGCLEPNMINC